MKLVKKKIYPLLIFFIFMIILFLGRRGYNNVICKAIEVEIEQAEYAIISQEQIKDYLFKNFKEEILNKKIREINIYKIEKILSQNPYIEQVKLDINNEGILKIKIKQSKPIVKIISEAGEFYLSSTGNIMKAIPSKNQYIIVANGAIDNLDLSFDKKVNINSLDREKNSSIFVIFAIAKELNNEKFLSKFFTQIYLKDAHNVFLVPRLGEFVVIVGDTNDLSEKFSKLHVFLDHIDKIGWNRYSAINLSYANQIVCTKNKNKK